MSQVPLSPAFNPLRYPAAFLNPEYVSGASAWVTHIPFGMSLVQMLRPRTFVELGTFNGDSYFALCQAVKETGTGTRCFAVDTWQGDPHAGFIPPSVLENLRAYHDPIYGSFSTLMQMTFDEAVARFEDRSIDLLHIDGLHTYEAVKHDYQTWLPKLSERAVVLFHDTAVQESDFGVYKFWDEVSAGRPHFHFTHGFGLGVLGAGDKLPEPFLAFVNEASQTPDLVRLCYFIIGHRIEMFRFAKTMIDGHVNTHRLIEGFLQAHGKGLHPLPNPSIDTGGFLNRISEEVAYVLRWQSGQQG